MAQVSLSRSSRAGDAPAPGHQPWVQLGLSQGPRRTCWVLVLLPADPVPWPPITLPGVWGSGRCAVDTRVAPGCHAEGGSLAPEPGACEWLSSPGSCFLRWTAEQTLGEAPCPPPALETAGPIGHPVLLAGGAALLPRRREPGWSPGERRKRGVDRDGPGRHTHTSVSHPHTHASQTRSCLHTTRAHAPSRSWRQCCPRASWLPGAQPALPRPPPSCPGQAGPLSPHRHQGLWSCPACPAPPPPAPPLLARSPRPVFPAAATPSPGLPGRQVSPGTRPSHSGTPQPPAGTPSLPGSGPAAWHLARGPPEALWGARPSRSPRTATWQQPLHASPRCGLSPAGERSQRDRARVLQHFPKAA